MYIFFQIQIYPFENVYFKMGISRRESLSIAELRSYCPAVLFSTGPSPEFNGRSEFHSFIVLITHQFYRTFYRRLKYNNPYSSHHKLL